MTVKKKLIVCTVIIFGVFLIINVLWFSTTWRKYHGYLNAMEGYEENEGKGSQYIKTIGDYRLLVKQPVYLDFSGGGFLNISSSEPYSVTMEEGGTMTANRDMDIVLYFWPQFWGGYKMGVLFDDIPNDEFIQIYVDKDLKYLPENNMDTAYEEEMNELISTYYDQIKEMFDVAVDIWGLEFE